ncbi:MAG: menaquinone biosynthesis protein [Bacteroidetes bacterium]|nr:menaquinone biosynthesis protein [Bacteroidota bacterium]
MKDCSKFMQPNKLNHNSKPPEGVGGIKSPCGGFRGLISIINYSNTIPFLYGLQSNAELVQQSEFFYHYPAQSVEMLCNNQVDIGIVPVAAIPLIPQGRIISKFCIGARTHVDSVCLCSNVDLPNIQRITLDYQSQTSNMLTKVLCKNVWRINPQFEEGTQGYETANDGTAKVIIGDRALQHKSSFAYSWDLAQEWYKAFGKPFVFACWVANKDIPQDYLQLFEQALSYGVAHIDDAIAYNNTPKTFDIYSYLHNAVSYEFDEEKQEALRFFYQLAEKM